MTQSQTAHPQFPSIPPTPSDQPPWMMLPGWQAPGISDADIERISTAVARKTIATRLYGEPQACRVCGAIEDFRTGTTCPYGSKYDGDYVCGECLARALDNAVDTADAVRNQRLKVELTDEAENG